MSRDKELDAVLEHARKIMYGDRYQDESQTKALKRTFKSHRKNLHKKLNDYKEMLLNETDCERKKREEREARQEAAAAEFRKGWALDNPDNPGRSELNKLNTKIEEKCQNK
jgi:hypothetical protein